MAACSSICHLVPNVDFLGTKKQEKKLTFYPIITGSWLKGEVTDCLSARAELVKMSRYHILCRQFIQKHVLLEGPAGTSRPKDLLQCIYATHIPKSATVDLEESAQIRATEHHKFEP